LAGFLSPLLSSASIFDDDDAPMATTWLLLLLAACMNEAENCDLTCCAHA
jgi:hypothetical protein